MIPSPLPAPAWRRGVARLPLVLLGGWVLSACAAGDSNRSTAENRDGGEAEVLATIDGTPITMADLEDEIGDRLATMDFEYQSERYQLIEAALEGFLVNRLLEEDAESRGISLEELIVAETEGKVEVREQDVVEWYRRNQRSLGGRNLEEVAPFIELGLRRLERNKMLSAYAKRLQEKRDVVYLLEPVRAEFNLEDSPGFGPGDARVSLVEFSDFECPFCVRFFHTLNTLKENYGDRVRIVYRQYPLDIHPSAFKAAEASLCAHDQHRFWEMHDLLFTEQEELGVEALKEKASRLGLDRAEFDECLDSGRKAEQIHRDMQEGDRAGIQGTPAIFVNGIALPGGAVPYEVVAEVIERELRRANSE